MVRCTNVVWRHNLIVVDDELRVEHECVHENDGNVKRMHCVVVVGESEIVLLFCDLYLLG